MSFAQAAALLEALWPLLEPLGEDLLQLLEGKIATARAAAATLPPTPIAPGVEEDLDTAKKGLDDA